MMYNMYSLFNYENNFFLNNSHIIHIGPRDSSTLYGHVIGKKCFLISDSWPLPLTANLSNVRGNQRTYTNLFKKNEPKKKLKLETPTFSCVNLRAWEPTKINK